MPSHHSHSSHSSHSSFHSSSSRSSFRSSPSRHSSSSYHSSYRSSSPMSYRNRQSYTNSNSYRPRPNIGVWHSLNSSRNIPSPRYYTSAYHQYVYIPTSWIDDNGQEWKAGYYNENGTYAQNLNTTPTDSPFDSSLLCECEYCGNSKIVNAEKVDTIDLTCPQCGAQMKVSSFQDKISETTRNEYVETSISDHDKAQRKVQMISGITRLLAILLLSGMFISPMLDRPRENNNYNEPIGYSEPYENNPSQSVTNPDMFGYTIYLSRTSSGSYKVVSNPSEADYTLQYDRYEDSYFCPELNEWFWHNTDVAPSTWQYWVEEISSDYGEYGWMEHDSDGWWIETSDGNWEKVPSRYNTSNLIYIE